MLLYILRIFAVLSASLIYCTLASGWGYGTDNGPASWKGTCQSGLRQSPIDIKASDVDYALLNRLHFVGYDQYGRVDLANNGHTVSASGFNNWTTTPTLMGGKLDGNYKLQQFHLHWAQKNDAGSEHTIGGLSYPAELHLVHYKEGLTSRQAMEQGDGIAVVGIFLWIKASGEPLGKITPALEGVAEAGHVAEVDKFWLRGILPLGTDSYYHYEGSLTTPGCNEAVQWYVLTEPISVTPEQLATLRKIQNDHEHTHEFNFRPTQPLNGRRILYRPSQYNRAKFCDGASDTFTPLTILMVPVIVSAIRSFF